MEPKPQRITKQDLPITINNLNLIKKVTYQKYAGNTLLAIGILIIFVGILTLLFGPNSLRVSLSGPTFTEFILLYPGPITSIGLFLIIAGSQITGHAPDRIQTYIENHYILCDEYNKPAKDAIIAAAPTTDGSITLDYLSVKEAPSH